MESKLWITREPNIQSRTLSIAKIHWFAGVMKPINHGGGPFEVILAQARWLCWHRNGTRLHVLQQRPCRAATMKFRYRWPGERYLEYWARV